jgi:hypothetical protein
MITKGILKATGAAFNVELGFIPDVVRIVNLATGATLEWLRGFGPATQGGIVRPATFAATTITQAADSPFAVSAVSGATVSALAGGAGVSVYAPGGEAGTVFRRRAQSRAISEDAGLAWTLDTSGSKTGHFSAGLPAGVGVGSVVRFADGSTAMVAALTNDGDADDEVTLDVAAPSAAVESILWAESHAAQAVDSPRNGFSLAWVDGGPVALLNTDGNRLLFEAGQYDVA